MHKIQRKMKEVEKKETKTPPKEPETHNSKSTNGGDDT
jgi:hypothetical protein